MSKTRVGLRYNGGGMNEEIPERRRQLSLYVPAEVAPLLERVRRQVDPVQHGLIPVHVTLCREDELGVWTGTEIAARLGPGAPLTLRFGRAEPFWEHGILLPCVGGEPAYHRLREKVLGTTGIRRLHPHITLAHPRNPKAPGNQLCAAHQLPPELSITFDSVRLIEQRHGGPWRVQEVFALG